MSEYTHVHIHHGCRMVPETGGDVVRCRRESKSKVLVHPTVQKPLATIRYGGKRMHIKVTVIDGRFYTYFDRSTCKNLYRATN